MTDSPRPTEEEQEQGPNRIEEEEEMRGPNPGDPELPGDDEGE
jgi:hypothetical protein